MKFSLNKDQRGLTPVMIVVAVVVVAAIGFIGYKVTQKDSVLSNATPAQKAVISECEKLYNDKELCKFAANSDIEKLSYQMVVTSTDAQGKTSTLTMLSDGKDNSQVNGTTEGQAYDAITLNGTSYVKDSSDGQWFKFAPSNTAAPQTDDLSDDIKVSSTFSATADKNYSYKKIGKEKCGKLTCFKYQFTDKTQPDSTQFVWFDTKDYRMQRFSFKDKDSSTDMVITYKSVKISEPSPTKDFSTGSGIDTQAIQQQVQASIDASGVTEEAPAE